MERLIAADPLPEAERLTDADQAEADALLARIVAEEPATQPARRARRRWLPAVAATAAAVVLAVVAIDVVDEDGPGPSVVDRAVAAVSVENSIYHTVAVLTFGHQHAYREGWFGPRVSHQKVWYRRGRLALEEVIRPWRTPSGRMRNRATVFNAEDNLISHVRIGGNPDSTFPEIDPAKDPAGELTQLKRQGRLRVTGSERFEGRTVYRLVGEALPAEKVVNRLIYLVDAKSYYPVAMQWLYGRPGSARVRFEARFTTYERLPATAANRALLRMGPHPNARPDRNSDGYPDASGGSGGR